jgi:CubicO group peptidase (beta-lactamase class C family)
MMATEFCPAPRARTAIPPTEDDTVLRMRRIQGEVQDENAWILDGAAGHAGLFSNVSDLLLLAGAILGSRSEAGAEAGKPSLFDSDTIEVFAQRQGPEGSSRALGWDTPSEDSSSGHHFSPRSIGHLGFSGCSLWIDRDAQVAVALLTNRTWPDRQCQLIRQIRPAFHDAVRESLQP